MAMRTSCRIPFGIAVLISISGCSIQQTVNPVAGSAPGELCIIENPDVREGFLPEMRAAIEDRGIDVRLLPATASIEDCDMTSTYVARWSWDMTIYMAYAEINVYESGELAGNALYDATSGGGRMDKFIDAEPKIRELVSQLFPAGGSTVIDPGEMQ